jgi:hypothetical protein
MISVVLYSVSIVLAEAAMGRPRSYLFSLVVTFCLGFLPSPSAGQLYVNGDYHQHGPYNVRYHGIQVDRWGTTVWFNDNTDQRELEAERIHEEKLLRMQLDHERALLEAGIRERKGDKQNAREFLRRERARDAVLSSKANAHLSQNPFNKVGRRGAVENPDLVPNAKPDSISEVSQERAAPATQLVEPIEFAGLRIFDTEQELLTQMPSAKLSSIPSGQTEYVVDTSDGRRAIYRFLDHNFSLLNCL